MGECRSDRPNLALVVMAATVALLALLAVPGPSGAQTTEAAAVGARATAQGVRTSLTMPGFLLVESVFDGGGPVAQAVLDPVGSASFASLPYPGETAMSVPGLIAAGGGPTLPAYPLYVSATPSQSEQAVSDPVGLYALRAVVSPAGATADGRLGSHGQAVTSGSQTHTEVSRTADAVTASAESVTEGIVVADGALVIGSVRSRSRTRLPRSGTDAGTRGPETTTELVAEGGRAGPVSFSYGPEGPVVNGGPVPLPAGNGLAALNQALAPAGVKVGIVRGEDVAGGRSSDVLSVDQQVSLPTGQHGVLHLRFGGTETAVGGSPLAADLGEGLPGGGIPAGPPAAGVPIGGRAAGPSAHNQPTGAPGSDASAPALLTVDQAAPGSSAPGADPSRGRAGAPALTGRRGTEALGAVPIGVSGVRFTGLRIAYWALAAMAGLLVVGSWRWRTRGAQRP